MKGWGMWIYWIECIDWGDVFHGKSSRGCRKDHIGLNPWKLCRYDLNCSRNGHLSEGCNDGEYGTVWYHEIHNFAGQLLME